jgi:hypothetical protein
MTVNLQPPTRTVLAWCLWLATFGCCATGLVVNLVMTRPLTVGVLAEGTLYALAFPLGYATVGLVLSLRRPANPIGWLFAASGLLWSSIIPLAPWVDLLFRDHRPLPLVAQLNAVAAELVWAPAITLGITLPALLLPDGRLRSRRWRVVVAAAVAGIVIFMGAGLLAGTTSETPVPVGNPLRLAGVALTVATAIAYTGLALHFACLPAALVCLVLRFRSSRGAERQQLRWVAAGASAAVVMLLVPLGELGSGWKDAVAVLCVPVSVAVAVLRYRLWELDRLVSRTVTYALVTGLLVVPYLLILPAATRLAAGFGSLAVAAPDVGGGGGLRPAAPPRPGPGRPALQPPPLRRRPHRGGVRVPPARPARPGRPRNGVVGRGRAHPAADPGVAVATPAGGHAHAPLARPPASHTMLACQPNAQDPVSPMPLC